MCLTDGAPESLWCVVVRAGVNRQEMVECHELPTWRNPHVKLSEDYVMEIGDGHLVSVYALFEGGRCRHAQPICASFCASLFSGLGCVAVM